MLDRIDQAFNFNEQALNLRHERQKILGGNIANADTPQYKARDINFAESLDNALKATKPVSSGIGLSTTSARHINIAAPAPALSDDEIQFRNPEQATLDGNTVDMDVERAQFMDNSVRYQAAMTLLNGQIRSMRSAMQE
jgi:flagellar basal-body rod protein FlgB